MFPPKLTLFLSTPSARRATLLICTADFGGHISIHALREEGDGSLTKPLLLFGYFYPRPPRGGRLKLHRLIVKFKFYFYPRPPRGGRRTLAVGNLTVHVFLSTPSARRATKGHAGMDCLDLFLSTPSARRATCVVDDWPSRGQISIHALREEGDDAVSRSSMRVYHFYPRPPRGGRPFPLHSGSLPRIFLSTPSARRATRRDRLRSG